MKKWKDKLREIKESRAQSDPAAMTEEERLAHEKYIQDLTAQNQKTVGKVCIVLWCAAMIGWAIFLVLDVVFAVGAVKIAFHAVGAFLTALLSLRRIKEWLASRKAKKEHTDA